ncbi:MAG: TIGR02391 family protein [Actinomycetota bacterium]|nr:TIGR02391 family protein [Actinomycetota bacterium]
MIFFTNFVTLIRRQQEEAEIRLGSPARVQGNTVLLPIGTEVQVGDHLEYRLLSDELRMMGVIDVVRPHMPGANATDDHIEVTCVSGRRKEVPEVLAPAMHPRISVVLALVADGRLSEAVVEALQLVEERVRSLTASDDSGCALMESAFGDRVPQLDITTTTGQAAQDEREGFRLLFAGVMLGLRNPHGTGRAALAGVDETLECLAVASLLMRRLDRAEERLG